MSEKVSPLPSSTRQSDVDYPGVVAVLESGCRLAVSLDGKRFVFQVPVETDSGPRWVTPGGRCPSKLSGIVAKFGGQFEGLAALCDALPEDPARLAGDVVARQAALLDVFRARDVARPDYVRVASEQGSLRVVVCPDAALYILQWVPLAEIDSPMRWRNLGRFATISALSRYMLDSVFGVEGSGFEGRVTGLELLPDIRAFLDGLPEFPSAGCWPGVPAAPVS